MKMEIIIMISVISVIVSIISIIVANKLNSAKFDIYTEKAIAKSTVIENEAQTLLKDAKKLPTRETSTGIRLSCSGVLHEGCGMQA